MRVVVFGASGQIGRFLLPRLATDAASVRAISRHPRERCAGVTWLRGTLPDAVPALTATDALVSLGPLDAFATWLERTPLAGAPRVVATSSMSAVSKTASPEAGERALAARLRDAEQRLAARCDALGAAWTVLRPTLIYGAGMDRSLTPLAHRALRWRVFPLPAGSGLRQPVHAEDVALAVLAALDRPQSAGQVIPLGGGECLTAAAMFARVRAALPVATLPLPIPRAALRIATRLLPRLRGPLTRLDRDLIADNAAAEHLLGITPRPFLPIAAV
jgi:nucleoside-diphosphate-sugar epimerase